MKIFCIGRNYADHIAELNNEVPAAPVIFMKPQTALLQGNKPFYLPGFSNDMHYECEVVLRICKGGRSVKPVFAASYYDAYTLGIDFTARDLQDQQKKKGLPWEIAKAFDHSAVVGSWQPLEEQQKKEGIQFTLFKNDVPVQHGDTNMLLHKFDEIIVYISQFFTLNKGDLLFTGTPKGVGAVQIGDRLRAVTAGIELLNFEIK